MFRLLYLLTESFAHTADDWLELLLLQCTDQPLTVMLMNNWRYTVPLEYLQTDVSSVLSLLKNQRRKNERFS